MRHIAVALCLVGLTAGTAAAKRMPTPQPLTLTRGQGPAAELVQSRAADLVACSHNGRATLLRMRVTLRWNRDGKVLRANSYGGSAAVNRCVAKVLGGFIPNVTGRGSAQVAYTIRRPAIVIAPAPGPMPLPVPPPRVATSALLTCNVDDDCTLHFQTMSCVARDPIAVNKRDPDAVRLAFPVKQEACGMGGPQYDQLRDDNERRWSASCSKSRCTVIEHAPVMKPTR